MSTVHDSTPRRSSSLLSRVSGGRLVEVGVQMTTPPSCVLLFRALTPSMNTMLTAVVTTGYELYPLYVACSCNEVSGTVLQ